MAEIDRGIWPVPAALYRKPAPAVERWRLNRYRLVHCTACMCSEIPSCRVRFLSFYLWRYVPGWVMPLYRLD